MVTKRGFSLVELIVVVGLLSLLMIAISSTSLMSVITSSRIRTATKVKQAGNYAVDQMSLLLRNTKSVVSCDTNLSTITFINQDGGTTTLALESTQIASNSGTYLTPSSQTVSNFSLTCLPSDTIPSLVKISFDLKDSLVTARKTTSPLLHFETSVNLRNE
jgi:prepilin-type N-terminal cleavage/methylation domain-containing protein